MDNRKIPDIVMDILKDYSMVDGGQKPLLEYLNELMASYADMEKTFMELSLWQEDMKKDIREMKIAMNRFKKGE